MPATPAPSGHEVRTQFELLLSSLVSEEAHEVTAATMERRLLGLELSTRMLTEQVAEDAADVEAFHAPQTPPPVAEEAALLVLQADGKGVPILRPATPSVRVRLGKGQKNGGKKEATLTGVYTIAPCVRTPEDVVESLFRETAPPAGRAAERTGPQHKRLWVT